ncbi:MAG: PAS domain S-box protein [gamma proteobacterium symbiont of Bathyaustriella thionipta]|nr:PAS domain S-box protein [gamma proteobacterium symbiont of Bathyaustriella thionipta]MCU7952132.1 PAS domain S-box protein [gamma proteobacterium symbiont of Bathyaustriella thionipta]
MIYLILALIGLIWVNFSIQLKQELNQFRELAINWDKHTDELMILSTEVLLFPSQQRLSRWNEKFEHMSLLLDQFQYLKFKHKYIGEIRYTLNKLPMMIKRVSIVALSEQAKAQHILNIQSRLQSISLLSANVSEKAIRQAQKRQHQTMTLLFGLFSIYLLTTIFLVFLFRRLIQAPINRLVQDISAIGRGDFTEPLNEEHIEELQIISDTINDTRHELSRLTVSRDELEHEMVKRRKAEEHYRILADYSLAWEYWLNPESQFTFVSPACQRVCGYTPQDFYNDATLMEKLIHSQDVEIWNEHFNEHSSTKPNMYNKVEFRIHDKEGVIHWILHECQPVFDSAQKHLGTRGVNRDITQQKLLRQTLQESEEKYKALYNNAPLSYQSLDEEGHFLDINPAWLKTLGYNREEVIGRPLDEFLHPDSRKSYRKNFPVFKQRGGVSDVQYQIRHKDGHYLDISYEGRVAYTTDGQFKQTYCVFQDITQRIKAEKESIRFNRLLEGALNEIYIFDSTTLLFLEVNLGARNNLGYSLEELKN